MAASFQGPRSLIDSPDGSSPMNPSGEALYAKAFNGKASGYQPEVEHHRQANDIPRSNFELEEFAYTVAHDLAEPLRTISAFADVLLERTRDERNKEIATLIVTGVVRMSAMLDDLLAFARVGVSETFGRVELYDAVTQA